VKRATVAEAARAYREVRAEDDGEVVLPDWPLGTFGPAETAGARAAYAALLAERSGA
jgi:hypothetical protein